MNVPLPLGDVVDKIAILRIKSRRIADPDKLAHVRREQAALEAAWREAGHPALESLADWAGLAAVNERLWDVEDELRRHEARGEFGASFVHLARSVYNLNDQRAAHKAGVNVALGSTLVEQKSYVDYAPTAGSGD
jgi:hypothetical protein